MLFGIQFNWDQFNLLSNMVEFNSPDSISCDTYLAHCLAGNEFTPQKQLSHKVTLRFSSLEQPVLEVYTSSYRVYEITKRKLSEKVGKKNNAYISCFIIQSVQNCILCVYLLQIPSIFNLI